MVQMPHIFCIPFFTHYWPFFGYWRPIKSKYSPKYTFDWIFQEAKGLYCKTIGFGNLEIIFGFRLCNFLFFTAFFTHLWLFFGYWRPIESNYVQKYTFDWLFRVANGLYCQTIDFGDLEIIFGFIICNFLFFTPFFTHLWLFFGYWRPIESN